jgi:hypothetical protein
VINGLNFSRALYGSKFSNKVSTPGSISGCFGPAPAPMQEMSLTQLVPVLQLAIGPVILISGVGLLLLTLTNRFGRMLDRSRSIIREISEGGQSPAAVANLNDQVEILHRRARILRLSITLAAVTVLGAGVLILGLFIAAWWKVNLAGSLVVIFCITVLALIGSTLAFIGDMNLSLRAAQLDWKLIGKTGVK